MFVYEYINFLISNIFGIKFPIDIEEIESYENKDFSGNVFYNNGDTDLSGDNNLTESNPGKDNTEKNDSMINEGSENSENKSDKEDSGYTSSDRDYNSDEHELGQLVVNKTDADDEIEVLNKTISDLEKSIENKKSQSLNNMGDLKDQLDNIGDEGKGKKRKRDDNDSHLTDLDLLRSHKVRLCEEINYRDQTVKKIQKIVNKHSK